MEKKKQINSHCIHTGFKFEINVNVWVCKWNLPPMVVSVVSADKDKQAQSNLVLVTIPSGFSDVSSLVVNADSVCMCVSVILISLLLWCSWEILTDAQSLWNYLHIYFPGQMAACALAATGDHVCLSLIGYWLTVLWQWKTMNHCLLERGRRCSSQVQDASSYHICHCIIYTQHTFINVAKDSIMQCTMKQLQHMDAVHEMVLQNPVEQGSLWT